MDETESPAAPSRVDRVWLALPYVLFLAGALPTWTAGELTPAETTWSIGLGAALLAWHTWWTVLHPSWLETRLPPMAVYFLGLLAAATALFSLTFNFFPLYLVCYPMAFVALPGGWAYGGVAVTTAVALLGPGLLTLSPQNVVVTVAGATLAAVAGGSIRALEVEAERRRSANAALTRAHVDLEVALADNVRLTERLVEEARQAGVAGERTRLAAEIHDTLAAGLSGILAQLEALDAELPAEAGAHDRIRTSIEVARESLQEARHSVGTLREAGSLATDLPAAVRATADRVSDRFDLAVEVRVVGPVRPVGRDVGETVVRAAREALTNVAKHADAEHAYVTVSYLDDRVAVDIADDGHGRIETSNGRRSDGHGLAIMTERLSAIGGTVEVAAAAGRGTTVTLAAPYRSPPGQAHDAG